MKIKQLKKNNVPTKHMTELEQYLGQITGMFYNQLGIPWDTIHCTLNKDESVTFNVKHQEERYALTYDTKYDITSDTLKMNALVESTWKQLEDFIVNN